MKKIFVLIFAFASVLSMHGAAYLGYLYPSSARRGTTVRVIGGGQGFWKNIKLISSVPGIKVKSVQLVPTFGYFQGPQRKWLDTWFRGIYKGEMTPPAKPENDDSVWRKHEWLDTLDKLPMLERSIVANSLYVRANPLQAAPSIARRFLMELEIAPDAPLGFCRLRIVAGRNISNEKLFYISDAPQVIENVYYPKYAEAPELPTVKSYPVVLNGQVMPGEADSFKIALEKDKEYTMRMVSSELSPYLGDAVPGHFQGILTLCGSDAREAAFADDEYHHPDPVLRFKAPESGVYTLKVSDSLRRGRADFVYFVSIKEGNEPYLPYKIFSSYVPEQKIIDSSALKSAIEYSDRRDGLEIRGVVDSPAGKVYAVNARQGERVIFELAASRIDSPLDGVLTLRDKKGNVIAQNDDAPQPVDFDICRRHTDPVLDVTFEEEGIYYLTVSDRTSADGKDYFYCLQMRPPMPSAVVASGSSVMDFNKQGIGKLKFFVHRKDGFNGEVKITSPDLIAVGKAVIPADKSEAELQFKLKNPPRRNQVMTFKVFAEYAVRAGEYKVPVMPADETMQAFAYTHLVAAENFYCFSMRPPQSGKKPAAKKTAKTVRKTEQKNNAGSK